MADPIITTTPITPVTAYSYIAEGELALQNWNDLVFQLQNNLNYLEDLAGIERTALVAMQRDGVRRLFAWPTTGATEWIDAIDAVRAALGFDEFVWPVGFAMSLIGGDRWMSAGDLRIMARAIGLPAASQNGIEVNRQITGARDTLTYYQTKKTDFKTRTDNFGRTIVISYLNTRDTSKPSTVSTNNGADSTVHFLYSGSSIIASSLTGLSHSTIPEQDRNGSVSRQFLSTLQSMGTSAVGGEILSRYPPSSLYTSPASFKQKSSTYINANIDDTNINSSIYEPQIMFRGTPEKSSSHDFTLTTNHISVFRSGGGYIQEYSHSLGTNEITGFPVSIVATDFSASSFTKIGDAQSAGSLLSFVRDYTHNPGYAYFGIEIDDTWTGFVSLDHAKPDPLTSVLVWSYPETNQSHNNGVSNINYMAGAYTEVNDWAFWFAARK